MQSIEHGRLPVFVRGRKDVQSVANSPDLDGIDEPTHILETD